MKSKKLSWIMMTILVGMTLLTVACGGEVEHQSQSEQVTLEGASNIQATIDFRAGDLTVQGGAVAHLLNAELDYNIRKDPPTVEYTVTDMNGELFLGVPDLGGLGASFGGDDNIWSLTFNRDVPIAMNLEANDADTTLLLADILLTRLQLKQNGREMDVDLSGSYPELTAVEIAANAGTGRFVLTGEYPILETIVANNNASALTFDLNGQWTRDLSIIIEGGTNNSVTFDLPEGVGVQLAVASDKVTVNAEGFMENFGMYINSTYGEADVTIYIVVSFKTGDVNLK